MMMHNTKVKFDKAPTVFAMMVKISFKDFQLFANLNTRSKRKDRNMDKPETPSANNSTNDRTTIKKSKQFQPS